MPTINAIGTPQITLGGTFTMSGAYTFIGQLVGNTNVTFPTSGTLATTGGTVQSIQGTANQVLVNGTSGSPVTGTAIILTTPQDIATTSSPTFLALTAGNLNLAASTISTVSANSDMILQPNGTGNILAFTAIPFNSIYTTSLQSVLPMAVARFTGAHPGTNSGFFMGFSSSSTGPGVFSASQVGDPMARLVAYGDDGTAFREAGLFQFNVTGTSSGIVSARALLYTSNTSGVRSLAMEITDAQIANFTNMVTSGLTTGGSAGTFLGYSPTASMGSTALVAANNAGNYANTLTNASTSAARTWTLPDASGTIALGGSTIPSIQGTANQVLVNGTSGTPVTGSAVTLTTPQDIATTSNVTFNTGLFGSLTSFAAGFQIQAVGVIGSSGHIAVASYNNSGNFANFDGYKSASATVGVFSAVGSTEPLMSLNAWGDDGTQFTRAATFQAFVDGTVSNGVVPGKFIWNTANASGVRTLGMTLNSSQQLILANSLLPASGGLGTGTAPSAGQIPIGNSGGTYTPAAINSGTNITVANGSATITVNLSGIVAPTLGGTGVNNGSNTLTLAGTLATSGAFASTFTMTGATNVTFPTSGTLATTASASGIVNSGLINQLTWYAATGTTVSGLATAANGVLITSAGSVPSISSTLPTAVQSNITQLGALIAYTNLATPGSGSANGFIFQGASAGAFGLQAGAGTAAGGGGLTMFGQNHPTKAGWVSACLSAGVGTAYFTVNNFGWLAGNTDVFTVNNAGQVVVGSPAAAAAGKITINPVTASLGTLQITAVNSAGAFDGLLQNASLSAARTWTLPDVAGTITVLGNTTTGSGSIALATSPTFVTPVLGAASATSINFGGSTLSTYTALGTWTPVFSFSTPGDLSVSYATQLGTYSRIGNIVTISLNLVCTPTFTTSSGSVTISGIPFTVGSATGNVAAGVLVKIGFADPATVTTGMVYMGSSYTSISIYGTTTSGTTIPQYGTTQFTTGVAITIQCSMTYFV